MLTRQVKLSLMLLITIIWFILIMPYFLLQTQFGAGLVSRYLSWQSGNTVNIGHLSLALSSPAELTLSDVTISDKITGTMELKTEKILLRLNPLIFWQNRMLDYIVITNGQLTLNEKTMPSILEAQRLQLFNVSVEFEYDNAPIHISNLSGGLKPFTKEAMTSATQTIDFDFTAQILNIANTEIHSFILSGLKKNDTLFFNNLGGQLQDGFFISKGKRLPNQQWLIDELQINHVHFQDNITLAQMTDRLKVLPAFTIKYFNLLDSSIDLDDLKIEKGNIELNNINYDQQIIGHDAELNFNAESLVWKNELWIDPVLTAQLDANKITIEKALAKWREGIISFSADWQSNQLTFHQLFISGINDILPKNWLNSLATIELPQYLSYISVNSLTLAPSTVVDTQATFSSQFTDLEATGNNLIIAQHQRFGLWQGNLAIKANHATINTITLRYPELSININGVNNQRQLHAMFNAMTDTGIIEATLTAEPENQQLTDLKITGYDINPTLLKLWYLIENPTEQKNFLLSLSGHYQPFNVSGTLTNKVLNQSITYSVQDNRILEKSSSDANQ